MQVSTQPFQEVSSQIIASTITRFTLKPYHARPKQRWNKIGYLGVGAFLTAAHFVFADILLLDGISYLLAFAPALILLLNVLFFFYHSAPKEGQLTIKIEEDELQLYQGHQLLHSAFLWELNVVPENVQTIRIQGPHFPAFKLGGPSSEEADYQLQSEQRWSALLDWFQLRPPR